MPAVAVSKRCLIFFAQWLRSVLHRRDGRLPDQRFVGQDGAGVAQRGLSTGPVGSRRRHLGRGLPRPANGQRQRHDAADGVGRQDSANVARQHVGAHLQGPHGLRAGSGRVPRPPALPLSRQRRHHPSLGRRWPIPGHLLRTLQLHLQVWPGRFWFFFRFFV